jgi:trk system potassium uptake protein TrkH
VGPRSTGLAVDVRAATSLCGTLLKYLSASALFPAAIALGYRENPLPFLAAGAIAAATGLALERVGSSAGISFREGYLVVVATWLLASAYGALPYLLSGEEQVDRPVDAFFEAMSGFTTTGGTILTDIESLDQSLLMWRQFTHWLGGMGIIVLALAVLPRLRVGGRQLLESEMPGPEVEPLIDRIRGTAQRLWLLYVALTAVEAAVFTLFGVVGVDRRMGWFEAVSAAFSTLPTGGFMPENRSWEEFAAASQWVAVGFMVLAGANLAVTYRAIMRRQPGLPFRDEEVRIYLAVLTAAGALLAMELASEGVQEGEAAIRHGAFQAISIMTTTGFATVDYTAWPTLAALTLIVLMFVGGSAGSTSGSIKIVRHLLLGKALRRELRQTVHPELVLPVRFNGAVIDERALRGVTSFILLYLGVFALGAAVIAVDTAIQGPGLSAIDVIAASASMLGNVGPGFGDANPMGTFAGFSDVSTLTMTALMWLGRLEVIPLVVLATRHYWRV